MSDVMGIAWFCLSSLPVEFTGLRAKEKIQRHPKGTFLCCYQCSSAFALSHKRLKVACGVYPITPLTCKKMYQALPPLIVGVRSHACEVFCAQRESRGYIEPPSQGITTW